MNSLLKSTSQNKLYIIFHRYDSVSEVWQRLPVAYICSLLASLTIKPKGQTKFAYTFSCPGFGDIQGGSYISTVFTYNE